MPESGNLLSAEQVGRRLGVSRQKVWRLARTPGPDQIPHVRLGHLIRFRPEDVDAYVAQHVRVPHNAT